MTFKECIYLIKTDLHRYGGNKKHLIITPGCRYMFFFRLLNYACSHRIFYPITLMLKIKLMLMQRHYGIQIPHTTKIGKGFYIGHYGDIVVNGSVTIGDNVNISQGVTIGQANRGAKKGVATIGNKVYIGPGVKIVGKITIGNNVAIGANAVVTKDVPDDACIAGIPAKIISMDGSEGYVNNVV